MRLKSCRWLELIWFAGVAVLKQMRTNMDASHCTWSSEVEESVPSCHGRSSWEASTRVSPSLILNWTLRRLDWARLGYIDLWQQILSLMLGLHYQQPWSDTPWSSIGQEVGVRSRIEGSGIVRNHHSISVSPCAVLARLYSLPASEYLKL